MDTQDQPPISSGGIDGRTAGLVHIARELLDTKDSARLLQNLDTDLLDRYKDPSAIFGSILTEEIEGEGGAFIVARLSGEAVGCVALRLLDATTGEIKRLFVEPSARRRGIGRELMIFVEDIAARLGYTRLRLETGTMQPESVALYRSLGWEVIPCFGEYQDSPLSICLEKLLATVDGKR